MEDIPHAPTMSVSSNILVRLGTPALEGYGVGAPNGMRRGTMESDVTVDNRSRKAADVVTASTIGCGSWFPNASTRCHPVSMTCDGSSPASVYCRNHGGTRRLHASGDPGITPAVISTRSEPTIDSALGCRLHPCPGKAEAGAPCYCMVRLLCNR